MSQSVICECANTGGIAQVFTWLIVVAGWFVVNRHQNIRERRKETRAQLDQVNALIKNLEDLSIKYHTNPAHDEDLARNIKRLLALIRKFTYRTSILEAIELNKIIINLRKSVTYKNFDNGDHHIQVAEDGDIVDNICNSCDEYIDTLERAFVKKFVN